jgi:hypothetical protein
MLLIQWHEIVHRAGSLLPCDVTRLTHQFAIVEPESVVRVVLALPQFCDLGVSQPKVPIHGVTEKRPFMLCAMIAPYTVG